MRTRRFFAAGLAALALSAGAAACSEEDRDQIEAEVDEQGENLEDEVGEVREDVEQEVDEQTDRLDENTTTTG